MRRLKESEKGTAMVEATLMLPFCMVMIVGMLYAALYLCQKANLQTNLETALLYYKNAESDAHVSTKSQMDFDSTGLEAVGSNYDASKYLNPYRFVFMKFQKSDFESFFNSICGNMFFAEADLSNVDIRAERHNYVIYKTIEATATQTITPPIDLSMVGGPKTMEIQVTGKVVINDGDDFIRNVDLAIDILADTKAGKWAQQIGTKAGELYDKFKNALPALKN